MIIGKHEISREEFFKAYDECKSTGSLPIGTFYVWVENEEPDMRFFREGVIWPNQNYLNSIRSHLNRGVRNA